MTSNLSTIDKTLLISLAKEYEVEITSEQAEKLDIYAKELIEWNKKINLTTIIKPEEIVVKHFIDSLTVFPILKEHMEKENKEALNIIDVGTGAGFPGLVLKIIAPQLNITLFDSLQKRIKVLRHIATEVDASVELIHSRAEDGGNDPLLREKFDIAVARAVAKMPTLSEYCIPFVKVGGKFIAMKGPNVNDELKEAEKAIITLGGDYKNLKVNSFYLPSSDDEKMKRNVIVIDKTQKTREGFPRNSAQIKSLPL